MEEIHLKKFQSWLSQKSVEGALLIDPINVSYFTGFTGDESFLFVTPEKSIFFTDSRYITQAKSQLHGISLEENQRGLLGVIRYINDNFPLNDLGLEFSYVTANDYLTVKKKVRRPLIDISPEIDHLRQVKDSDEILKIRRACEISDQAFALILEEIRPGMTELAVAAKLESHFKELGASGPSFSTIVASGARSALPHGIASDKEIHEGDLVTLDFGCYYHGYTSDITRTIGIGHVSEDQKNIYQLVLRANKDTIKILQQGVTGTEMHEKAHQIIDGAGYKKFFQHGVGHGIGRSVHEGPGSWGVYRNNPVIIGNVITIEPGVYLPNRFGVRIEDDVLITDHNYEVLTKAPKDDLIII